MLIKKQIVKSNIYMVIIPAALIMIISIIMFLSYAKIYNIPKKARENDMKKSEVVQSIVLEFSNRMQYSENINNLNKLQSELQNQLIKVGYYTQITLENEIIASNFTDEIELLGVQMGGENISMPKSFSIHTKSAWLIRNSFQKDGNIFAITAINPNYIASPIDWEVRMMAMSTYSIIMFVLSIIIIIVTNAVISIKLTRKIINPLDLLNYGAEQIKNGNLDFNINYDSNDEFGMAISNFDEMRDRLQKSIQTQIKYEEDRKELVAGISHDLRTPLTSIKGYVKGLKDGIANTTQKQQRYHDIIYYKACEMDVLVDKLFLFSKLDTGHLPFYLEKVYCREYLDEFVKGITEDFKRKGLEITYKNTCHKDTAFKIDHDQMSRVFSNILENSAKYKSLDVCHVDFAVRCQEREVIVEICDDGNGVPEEILPNLFKSFYRGDVSRTNPNESSGLGLSIAERIVKAHNGKIDAQNKNGLAIIIKLPVIEEE